MECEVEIPNHDMKAVGIVAVELLSFLVSALDKGN
jgi:hypothetical protein